MCGVISLGSPIAPECDVLQAVHKSCVWQPAQNTATSRDYLARDSDLLLSLTLILPLLRFVQACNLCQPGLSTNNKKKKKQHVSVGAVRRACLINKTWAFLFLGTRCLLRSADMSFLCFPPRLKTSHRHLQDKCWRKWRDWSFLTLVWIIHAKYLCRILFRLSLFFKKQNKNAVLTELVFLLLVSLIIKKPCLTAAAAPLIRPQTAKP